MTQMDLFQTATSSQQDTPASPFHLPGSEEAQKMTDISGHTFFPLLKPSDPLGAFSRMFMGLDEVLSDLERESYATRPFIVPACATDAPHRRDRVWIIAHANSKGEPNVSRHAEEGKRMVADTNRIGQPGSAKEQIQRISNEPRKSIRGSQDAPRRWPAEPAVGRVVNGLPRRMDRLRGLGNAIVPQIAMRIGMTIKETG